MGAETCFSLVRFLPVFLLFLRVCYGLQGGMLYPRDSESRSTKDLNGMWNFRADTSRNRSEGFDNSWYKAPLSESGSVIPMPVPSSYNDVTESKSLRDFVGWVWYDREFFPPKEWKDQRIVLRVDSAHYNTIVWLNGVEVMSHVGGHLPFETAINDHLQYGKENLLTIAVNNTLTPLTLPPGTIKFQTDTNRYPPGFFTQVLQFDFFNYAGIHRSVKLYATPKVYVDDITVVTTIDGTTGIVNYKVSVAGAVTNLSKVAVNILDKRKQSVASGTGEEGKLSVAGATFWWPYTMNATHFGYMYTLQVEVTTGDSTDVYRQPFGIRTVQTTETQLLINNKAFYCHGAAKHEDSDIRGKGLDLPLIAKDFNMLKWLGANCFRTSHYPYAEEIMDQADQQGIVVIDECPGVGIHDHNMGPENLAHHREVMEELVRRDKNRPSAIMWSVANEPRANLPQAHEYFGSVINHTRMLDPTRPVTYVIGGSNWQKDQAAQYVDVLCVNHYYGWYSDTGHTEVIKAQMTLDLTSWHAKFKKPVIVTEYGADTVAGLHQTPSFIFTEEYQVDFMGEYHKVFDDLRNNFLVGEMVWNFADFMTDQQITRVVGNKKGVLTRQRQPKYAAHKLRERYNRLINESLTKLQEEEHEQQNDILARLLSFANQVTLSDPYDVFVAKLCESHDNNEAEKGQDVAPPSEVENVEEKVEESKPEKLKEMNEIKDNAIHYGDTTGGEIAAEEQMMEREKEGKNKKEANDKL